MNKVFAILLVGLLMSLGSSPGWSDTWTKVVKTDSGDTFYIDLKSIRLEENNTRVYWKLVSHTTPFKNQVYSRKALHKVNCDNLKFIPLKIMDFNKPMGKGLLEIWSPCSEGICGWQDFPRDSAFGVINEKVCGADLSQINSNKVIQNSSGTADINTLGLYTQRFTDEIKNTNDVDRSLSGILLSSLGEQSPAAGKLIPGDVLVKLNGHSLKSNYDLALQMQLHPLGEPLDVYLYRGLQNTEERRFLTVRIKPNVKRSKIDSKRFISFFAENNTISFCEALGIAKPGSYLRPVLLAHQEHNKLECKSINSNPTVFNRTDKDPNKVVRAGSGSGFAVSSDGYVITNHHVINGCKKVFVHTNGKAMPTDLVTYDRQNDLALLKADFKPEAVFPLSNKRPELLQDIYVAGYPFGKKVSSSVKVTKGIISSLTGTNNNFARVQIDAAIQTGNSGGPILDDYGNVVGVAVSKLDVKYALKNFGSIPENTNFGIKSSVVGSVLDSHGVNSPPANDNPISTSELGKRISKGTYYISCWMTMAQIEKMRTKKVMFSDLN